jgi:hypothetical protein
MRLSKDSSLVRCGKEARRLVDARKPITDTSSSLPLTPFAVSSSDRRLDGAVTEEEDDEDEEVEA